MPQEIWYGPKRKPGSIRFTTYYMYGIMGWEFDVAMDRRHPRGLSFEERGLFMWYPNGMMDLDCRADIAKLLRFALLFRETECGCKTPLKNRRSMRDLEKIAARMLAEEAEIEAREGEIELQRLVISQSSYCGPVPNFWRMGGGAG